MTLAIDLAIVGIILICIWHGFRAGIINGICGLLALCIAVYGGFLAAKVYSPTFTPMFEPFLTGIVDSAATKVLTWDTQDGDTTVEGVVTGDAEVEVSEEEKAKPPIVVLVEDERSNPYAVSYAVYRQLGIADEPAQAMAHETYDAVSGEMGQGLMVQITESICGRLSWLLVFYIGFGLIAIVFFAIGNVLDLSFGMPGIENVNHIVGAVLGCAKGIGVIIVLACIFRYAGLLVSAEELESTWFLKMFVENNIAAGFLGI